MLFLGHSSLATGGNSTSVDQHIQAGKDMFAQSQEELSKLFMGGNSDVEETKEAIMGDETAHRKRSLSDSDLSTSTVDNA